MSIVEMNAEMAIANVVEAMLPRFSSHDLGLLTGVDMGLTDFGFGADGNTEEREGLSVRRYPWFLFVRPNNYTKVYYWLPPKDCKGLDFNPLYKPGDVWTEIADHDSCWRDAIGSALTKLYFASTDLFKGRKISGKDLRPIDLSQHIYMQHSTPCYVKISQKEQVNANAKRYSEESRATRITITRVGFKDIKIDESDRLFLK